MTSPCDWCVHPLNGAEICKNRECEWYSDFIPADDTPRDVLNEVEDVRDGDDWDW